MQTTLENTNIESAIANRDTTRCKELYKNHLIQTQVDKYEYPLVQFLFDSLESKRITATQKTIDDIQFINKNG